MKKALLILALLPFFARSQVVDFGKFATKQDLSTVNTRLDSIIRIMNGSTPPVIIPVANCKRSPRLESWINVTATSLEPLYDGEDVFEIYWRVVSGSDTLRAGWIAPQNNHPVIVISPKLPAGKYALVFYGKSCKSLQPSKLDFTIQDQGSGGGPVIPEPINKSLLGTYETVVNGRSYIASKSPSFALSYTANGVSDATPGLKVGTPNKLGDRDVYYMLGYSTFGDTKSDGTKVYNSLQNVVLPDGIYSVRQFRMRQGVISSIEDFRSKLGGWGASDVNLSNGTLHEIFLTVKTAGAPVTPISWLTTTRRLEFVNNGIQYPADGTFGTYMFNVGDNQADYQKIGVNTESVWVDGKPIPKQPKTFKVWKWGVDNQVIPIDQLISNANQRFNEFGITPSTIVMDEYPENTQGRDPAIGSKMKYFYGTILDNLRKQYPGIDKKDTGLFGSYGIDADFGLNALTTSSRAQFEESLTSNVHDYLSPGGEGWRGLLPYYAWGDIDVRNVNLNFYMYNSERNIPNELLYMNERIKVGSMTFEGKNREANWNAVTMPMVQSLVLKPDGSNNGIEYTRDGESIQYRNGVVNAQLTSPSIWDEYYPLGFYTTLLSKGIALWGEWGVGQDSTKFNDGVNLRQIKWQRTGRDWVDYASGQLGAPVASSNGLNAQLTTSPVDAAYAGWRLAKQLRGRSDVIYHASYSSDKKKFTAVPGDKGLQISGRGFINKNLFVTRDIYEQKAATVIVGEGPEGNMIAYYNGYLSQHEKEENVIVIHKNRAINIGTCYGRQLKTFTF